MELNVISYIPLIIISLVIGVTSSMLAREKGRNVALWTVVGLIPFVNIPAFWFFVGAANLRTEHKLDQLLQILQNKP